MPAGEAATYWQKLRDMGVRPCGLGARDTLRLEAGMNLYGNDMDETTSPLESGLGWTVAWEPQDRDFVGRAALTVQKASGDVRKFVGLLVEDRAVLRTHQKVIVANVGEGEVTSGTFSPTLQRSIGFARVPAQTGDRCEVEIRGKLVPARVVKPPFVRNGKAAIAL
jgi:aminomethyltransferase